MSQGCCSRTCASKQGIIAPLKLWLSGKYILPKVLLSMIMALNDRHNCINAVDFAWMLIPHNILMINSTVSSQNDPY